MVQSLSCHHGRTAVTYQTSAVLEFYPLTKPVYGFCEGIYRSVALHLTTSMGLFSVDGIDRSVSVTIWVYKPCIDQGRDRLLHLAQSFFLSSKIMSL